MNKMVSVIVPAYNAERSICKCLHSLMAQTYCNLEVLVVNDGSTDNTQRAVEDMMSHDRRIHLLNQTNAGPSAARNTGIRMADGDYIGFVDSDDYVEKDFVERLVAGLEAENCDLSMCGFMQETLSGVERFRSVGQHGSMSVKAAFMGMYVPQDRSWGSYSWNKLYKKCILEENQVYFPEGVSMFEDVQFNWHYLKCCTNAFYIQDALYHYIVNDTGLTHNIESTARNIEKWISYAEVYDSILQAETDRDIYHMLNMQRTAHTATAVRVLHHLKQKGHPLYRKKRKLLVKNLGAFLFYKDIPLKKRLGAIITLISPKLAFYIWNRN